MGSMPLKKYLKENDKLNAENPIDHRLLGEIPFFKEVFSEDVELWEMISKLAGASGIAHIEDKQFKPGQKIIGKESIDQMVFWVISGEAEAISEQSGKQRVVKRFKKGDCFGEITIIKGQPRTSDVIAGKEGVRVVELDWALADRCFELKALFAELMLKTVADKLENTFGVPGRIISGASKLLKERDEKIQALQKEIHQLKKL